MEHNFNFLPERIIKSNDSEGNSMFSRVYTLDAWGNLTILQLIFLFLFLGVLVPFASLLLLIFYCIDAGRRPYGYNIAAIFVSIYILLDIGYGWFFGPFIKSILTDKELHNLIYLNGIMILSHLILLFGGQYLLNLGNRNKLGLFVYMVIISICLYPLVIRIFSSKLINIF